MNVYVLIPTAQKEHVGDVLAKWRAQGYKIGLFCDPGFVRVHCDLLIQQRYPGIWKAWNMLAKAAFANDADVVVLAGDDMWPDPHRNAEQIALEYLQRFPSGFGIMQPTGDMQGDLVDGQPNAGRICGSPWFGKQWCISGYGGEGPVNGNYTAFYADEELQIIAAGLGKLWQRPDLIQKHLHWSWGHLPKQEYHDRNQKSWEADKALFDRRKAEGFLA